MCFKEKFTNAVLRSCTVNANTWPGAPQSGHPYTILGPSLLHDLASLSACVFSHGSFWYLF